MNTRERGKEREREWVYVCDCERKRKRDRKCAGANDRRWLNASRKNFDLRVIGWSVNSRITDRMVGPSEAPTEYGGFL